MKPGHLFSSGMYVEVQEQVKERLNALEDFMTSATVRSTRAAGDAIEGMVANFLEEILGDFCTSYHAHFERRAMADLAFYGKDDTYYVVDVKTHRTDTKFNMPNLISVERISRFYTEDTHYFTILFVTYSVHGQSLQVEEVQFVPIEYLDWECLTVGALGWGQIQIANSNRLLIRPQSRQDWMLQLCERMLAFYPREIQKIERRMQYFEEQKQYWECRTTSL